MGVPDFVFLFGFNIKLFFGRDRCSANDGVGMPMVGRPESCRGVRFPVLGEIGNNGINISNLCGGGSGIKG